MRQIVWHATETSIITATKLLGVVGENNASEIVADVSSLDALFPGADYAIIAMRPDGVKKPILGLATSDNGVIRVSIEADVVAVDGDVLMELRAYQGEKVAISLTVAMRVMHSPISEPDPDNVVTPPWALEVLDKAEHIVVSVDAAESAANRAEEAANSVVGITFSQDEDGHLIQHIPEQEDNDLGRVEGLSAYEVWLSAGNTGTVEDYLSAIKGADGKTGTIAITETETANPGTAAQMIELADSTLEVRKYKAVIPAGATGQDGLPGTPGRDGTPGVDGTPGADGKTAYASAIDGGYEGDEETFNADLADVSSKMSIAEYADVEPGRVKDAARLGGQEATNFVQKPSGETQNNVMAFDSAGNAMDTEVPATRLPILGTTAQRTVYIATTGTDANDGLTTSRPMATVAGALSRYGGTDSLRLLFANGTYDIGDIQFYSGVLLTYQSQSGLAENVTLVGRMHPVGAMVQIYRLTLKAAALPPVYTPMASTVTIRECIIDGGGTDGKQYGVYMQYGSTCTIFGTTFSNCSRAIYAYRGCMIGCSSVSINESCDIGIYNAGSVIVWGPETASHYNQATTQETITFGGQIFH